jgi:predicted  nucleic acid-binding Zn-ribbon protein
VKQKQAGAQEKEAELSERRKNLKSSLLPVEDLKTQTTQMEVEVATLESKMATLESSVEHAVKMVHQEQDGLAEFWKQIPDDKHDQFSGLHELLVQNN